MIQLVAQNSIQCTCSQLQTRLLQTQDQLTSNDPEECRLSEVTASHYCPDTTEGYVFFMTVLMVASTVHSASFMNEISTFRLPYL